jgi:replicative DNA helicase
MSNEIKEKAKEYLKLQLSVIPAGEDKVPTIKWKKYESERMKEEEVDVLFNGGNVKYLGIVCGAISGNLEVIDVDTKHDKTNTLWDNLRGLIEDNLPEIYKSLVIAQTKSGGYHIYYKCSSIAKNIKLSNKTNRDTLIETRGEGGYVVAPPSPGYKYLQGDPSIIPTITPEDRNRLFSIARSFNELEEVKPKIPTISSNSYSSKGNSPFEDYNQRGDLLSLLESRGWKVLFQSGQNIHVLRPGDTDSKTSGNFNLALRTLKVFSSSTEFNPDKAYSPAQVFSLLECSGDHKLAYRRLLELGYGEPYNGEEIRPTQLSTQQIKVEVVNTVNRESSVISSPGESLKIESIESAPGDEIIINSPGSGSQEEVLRAIELIQQCDKRIYINEGGVESRSYTYQLQAVFNRYEAIEKTSGELTERERDNFLDEVIAISFTLQPIEKDIYLKSFLDLEPVKELGITAESLELTVDRLTSTIDKANQEKDVDKLLRDFSELRKEGKTKEGLELLESKSKEVKQRDKATEFSKLLVPVKQEELRERLSNQPESLDSGYIIDGEPLLIPAKAISVISAPTSHGKTSFLINLALNISRLNTNKEFHFFSYEEDSDSILINALNTYLDTPLSGNNRTTLTNNFAGRNSKTIEGKDRFFQELIDNKRLNIHYSNYTVDLLLDAIRYLHKNANVGAIFIDYIQLLNLPGGKYKTYSRQEEMKQICIELKDLAVETKLPIIVGAQFNRTVQNHLQIHATRLGEAGDIERIANLIVGIYNNNFTPVGTEGELSEIARRNISYPNTLFTTILKNRGGKAGGEELLTWNGNTGKIGNRPVVGTLTIIDPFKQVSNSKPIVKPPTEKEKKEARAMDIVRDIRSEIASDMFSSLKDLTENAIAEYLTRKNSGELIDEVLKMLKPDLKLAQINRKATAKKSKQINPSN